MLSYLKQQSSILYQTDEELDRLMMEQCDMALQDHIPPTGAGNMKHESLDFSQINEIGDEALAEWDMDDLLMVTCPPLASQIITPIEKGKSKREIQKEALQDLVDKRVKDGGSAGMVPCNHTCKNKKEYVFVVKVVFT